MISYCELKPCEEKSSPSLSVIEFPCAAKVFQVAMVSENGNLDPSSQCHHSSKAAFIAISSLFPTS